MGHFSFLSDAGGGGGSSSSGDEAAAVEELLNQAMDHSVLQQVSAINCASFSSDSVLPSHLENRFRRLKSLPATNPHAHRSSFSSSFNSHFPQFDRSASVAAKPKPHPEQPPNQEKGLKPKSGTGSGSSPSKSSNSSAGDGDAAEILDRKWDSASKSRSRSFLSSPSNLETESQSQSPSPSPPKKSGCFWCSPKKVSGKKSKENNQRMMKGVGVDWDRHQLEEDLLSSDLGIFSAKEHQKMLKKAMKEEEKINREAEKIVKWAKQASARMNVSEIEELVGDFESPLR